VGGWAAFPSSGHTLGTVSADGDGRYAIAVPSGARILMWAWTADTVQPCVVSRSTVPADDVDIELVSAAWIAAGNPSVSVSASPVLSGVVYEQTASDRTPLAQARVYLELIPDLLIASTVTDGQGRYSICGVPDGEVYVEAGRAGYEGALLTVQVSGSDLTVDIRMRRQ
jgi:carboxypeptidase family protein